VGTLSTAILLFGVSYYYGYFGSTGIHHLQEVASLGQKADIPLSMIIIFLVAGIGFKLDSGKGGWFACGPFGS